MEGQIHDALAETIAEGPYGPDAQRSLSRLLKKSAEELLVFVCFA